jgi:glycine dehydrogenase (decarboxylating)
MANDNFVERHNGPRQHEIAEMLNVIGVSSVDELINQVVPEDIKLKEPLKLEKEISEYEFALKVKQIASKNKLYRSFIGMGYYPTYTPAVIQRNIFENPSWYTSYTPYQAEISQGRLEALLNFQTVILSLTGMEISNCSLLDEATAAAEAMTMMLGARSRAAVKVGKNVLFVDEDIFPQTLDVINLRATPRDIEVVVGKFEEFELTDKMFGAIVQYPTASGKLKDYSAFTAKCHEQEILVTAVCDILSLALVKAPAEWGADIAVGSTQRFGIPMGFGGPHAAYLATKDEYKRSMPGRIIGVSVDRLGKQSLRMALQTREQHIKREKATSNICTAQALLASMAGMFAVYYGPEGVRRIALHAHNAACAVNKGLVALGYKQHNANFFDTLEVEVADAKKIQELALFKEINFFYPCDKTVRMSFDEVTTEAEIQAILDIFAAAASKKSEASVEIDNGICFDKQFERTTAILTEKVFNKYQSETEMMRYIKKLERKDISLTHSMISLGSCTMKLNAAAEMLPLSFPEFAALHPFVPADQAEGYYELLKDLENDLAVITGFAATSLQPNSGAAGEYSGLMVIRQHHINSGQEHRNVAIIPASAHGTNPASAAMAGMEVVVVACDENGNINVDDLREKANKHRDNLSCLMVTYPSTHGVFERRIREMVDIIHEAGGQVYMDGANMNAQVALTNPGFIGADVCHLNLHKTFAIPHGGGGPGVGPICVAKHLAQFLPSHSMVKTGGDKPINSVAAAPFGSASVVPITYSYIKMLGAEGLKKVTEMAILNANYLSKKLEKHYSTLYTGETGRVGHECIIDVQHFKREYGIDATDIAKRLMDFGFHAPTLSFPVHETLMVEPTESESVQEIDRFVEAMIAIKNECEEIKNGTADAEDNVLKMAPHTAEEVCGNEWNHKYDRMKAAYPLEWIKENKFWPASTRVDNGFGDRNLVCTCASIESYL